MDEGFVLCGFASLARFHGVIANLLVENSPESLNIVHRITAVYTLGKRCLRAHHVCSFAQGTAAESLRTLDIHGKA